MAWADRGLNNKREIGAYKYTGTVSASASSVNITIDIPMALKHVLFEVPALDASDTAELIILDADGKKIYESGELAMSTDHSIPVIRYLTGDESWSIETSTAQAADRDFVIKTWFL